MTQLSLSEYDFKRFKDIIYKESGICFNVINKTMLETKIMSVLRDYNIDDINEFYDLIYWDNKKLIDFIDTVTTNLTKFFRIEKHFQALSDYVLPKIMEEKLKNNIRDISIWSAGCSTGEEPYSIAMTCLENLNISKFDLRIYASDISLKSLIKAKEGSYVQDQVSSVPKNYLNKYFEKFDKSYVVNEKVKDVVMFDYHNLINKGIQNNIDVIFCRNVLIYFDEQGLYSTIQRFYKALGKKGYLFIGHSESLFGFNTSFRYEKINGTTVYIKNEIGE